jgi:hypothetical protein
VIMPLLAGRLASAASGSSQGVPSGVPGLLLSYTKSPGGRLFMVVVVMGLLQG